MMAQNSINTNYGAMTALQNLAATQTSLATTSSRVNTGLRIASAKDNGAVWAIAQTQNVQKTSLESAVTNSLNNGKSVLDTTIQAGAQMMDVLNQMRAKALAASDSGVDDASRSQYQAEYTKLAQSYANVVASAGFNGVNLIDESNQTAATPGTVSAIGSADGSVKIASAHNRLGAFALFNGGNAAAATAGSDASLTITAGASNPPASTVATVDTVTQATSWADGTGALAAASLGVVDAAIKAVTEGMSSFGVDSKAMDNQINLVSQMIDSLKGGIGNLVDANLAQESANLQSLQTKQQLGVQALSIANQSTGILLSLFR